MTGPATGLAPRERAHTILHEVLDRARPLDEVLQTDNRFAKLNERDRAFARNLVATTLRRLGQIDAAIGGCLDRPLPASAAAARNALRLGACQILFLDTQNHAAVDTAVQLTARRGPERFKGVVNAVLRRLIREGGDALAAKYPESLNIPDWLRESWTARFGAEAASRIAVACLAVPPVDLTVRDEPDAWARRLGGEVVAGRTVRLSGAGDITALQGFGGGAWWVQDAAAALPAQILMSALTRDGGDAVCDLCAAPGGKTAQFAAAGLAVTAVDVSAPRLALVRENLLRLGLSAELVETDATNWRPQSVYPGVLLDAPCTATGTIRRHPDIPRLKRPADVTRQATLQKRLLDNAANLVGDGGALVYSVCSLQPEEGPAQIEDFLSARKDFVRDPIAPEEVPGFAACIGPDGDVVTLPGGPAAGGSLDGFYIARLRRTAAG